AFAHAWQQRLRQLDRCHDVDREQPRRVDVFDVAVRADPRAVHEHVDRACPGRDPRRRTGLGQIDVLLAGVEHLRPGRPQRGRRGKPDPAGRTRDDANAAGQLHRPMEPHARRRCISAGGGPTTVNEAELIARAKRGDGAAYEELVRMYQGIAFRTAWLVAGNTADAEEAAQDGFLKADETP